MPQVQVDAPLEMEPLSRAETSCLPGSKPLVETLSVRSNASRPALDVLDDLHALLDGETGGHDQRAEVAPRHLDLPRKVDLLLARQQRDLAHLREVHAHRVVDALGGGRPSREALRGDSIRTLARLVLGEVGLVEDLDARVLEEGEHLIDIVDVPR